MIWILGILKIVVLLGTLITIHELGHFLMARLFKVKVLKFAIGFGPKIFTKATPNTEYTLRLIPFGGFVQMEGEEERSNDENAFNKKPIWQRILIVSAGAIVNITFALIIYFAIAASANQYESSILTNVSSGDAAYVAGFRTGDEILKVNNKRTLTGWKVEEIIENAKSDDMLFEIERNGKTQEIKVNIPYTVRGLVGIGFSEDKEVLYLSTGTPASECGIEVGDVVMAIDGVSMNSTDDVVNVIRSMPGKEITIQVMRNEEKLDFKIIPNADNDRHFDLAFEVIQPGFFEGIKYAFNETAWYLGANMKAYGELFTGTTENVEVMGVVGIASEITKTSAWDEFFYMMCAISLSLGVFNLLPIPALDGGRILLLIVEGIRRKPLNEKLEQTIILVGFAAIILFAIVVTVFDIGKLF